MLHVQRYDVTDRAPLTNEVYGEMCGSARKHMAVDANTVVNVCSADLNISVPVVIRRKILVVLLH